MGAGGAVHCCLPSPRRPSQRQQEVRTYCGDAAVGVDPEVPILLLLPLCQPHLVHSVLQGRRVEAHDQSSSGWYNVLDWRRSGSSGSPRREEAALPQRSLPACGHAWLAGAHCSAAPHCPPTCTPSSSRAMLAFHPAGGSRRVVIRLQRRRGAAPQAAAVLLAVSSKVACAAAHPKRAGRRAGAAPPGAACSPTHRLVCRRCTA